MAARSRNSTSRDTHTAVRERCPVGAVVGVARLTAVVAVSGTAVVVVEAWVVAVVLVGAVVVVVVEAVVVVVGFLVVVVGAVVVVVRGAVVAGPAETLTVPNMNVGWTEQWYENVPGLANVTVPDAA
jgi:hypothetical protein